MHCGPGGEVTDHPIDSWMSILGLAEDLSGQAGQALSEFLLEGIPRDIVERLIVEELVNQLKENLQ